MRLITSEKHTEGYSSATYLLWQTDSHDLVESSILYIHGRSVPLIFCLPSSVGCSIGCLMCAVPEDSSPRSLDGEELLRVFEYSRGQVEDKVKFQVSFMGQGEPLLNIQNIFKFCGYLYSEYPEATIGISTVGIAAGISALSDESWAHCVKLQISLHAWPPDRRKRIIPVENIYPAKHALSEAKRFGKRFKRQCALNCVLLDGINDSPDDAQQIAEVAADGPFYVKVSNFNPHNNCTFRASNSRQMDKYCEVLRAHDIEVHRFRSIGTTIGAGCGQTRLTHLEACSLNNVRNALYV